MPEEQTKDNLKVLNQIWADRGPSDAERMNAACVVINDDQGDTTLDEKLQAWDDLELLVESLVFSQIDSFLTCVRLVLMSVALQTRQCK